jgi:hypothetical protein
VETVGLEEKFFRRMRRVFIPVTQMGDHLIEFMELNL